MDLSGDWKSPDNTKEVKVKIEVMLQQADTFRGFERMIWALSSLEEWKSALDENQ